VVDTRCSTVFVWSAVWLGWAGITQFVLAADEGRKFRVLVCFCSGSDSLVGQEQLECASTSICEWSMEGAANGEVELGFVMANGWYDGEEIEKMTIS